MNIKTFVFNSFQVNTYLIHNNNEAIIIDPACYSEEEKRSLLEYVDKMKLSVKMAINTHAHVDHILGNAFVKETFNCLLYAHKDSEMYFKQAPSYASVFGLDASDIGLPDENLQEGQQMNFGETSFQVIYSPGHAEGSICLYFAKENILFSGDVLFKEGIGRSDLPGGNHDLLIQNIESKLFTLPAETTVYPGHGPSTTIGEEKENNPFF
jgi:glyoxylase-like metal-dependent hydrolase (beta-lactamase superfamily II)